MKFQGFRTLWGGHKITADNFTFIFEGSNVVLKNGTFDSNGGSYALWIGDEDTTDNFLIEDITSIEGINIYNATNVVLRNVNVLHSTEKYYAIWCDINGNATIESGTYVEDNGSALIGLDPSGSSLTIKGGTFMAEDKPLVLDTVNFNSPVITGGIYDTDPSDFVSKDSTFIKYVDSEGNVSYAAGADSIAELLADAGKGDTVTVLQGSSVTIPAGVTVINESGDKISVNGVSVDNNEQVVAEPSADLNKEPNTNPTTDKVAANGSSDSSANTGDDSNLMVWVVLLILAGFGACTAARFASSKNDRM